MIAKDSRNNMRKVVTMQQIVGSKSVSQANESPFGLNHALRRLLHKAAKPSAWLGGGLIAFVICSRAVNWAAAAIIATVLSTMAFGQKASMPVLPAVNKPDAAILKVAETYRKAVVEGNVDAALSVYRDDAVEMPAFQAPVVGKPALEHFYRGMFQGPVKVSEFTLSPSEAAIDGNTAYDVGTYTRTMSGAPSGTIHAVGTYVVILKRTGADWKVAYATYTCDCPNAMQASSLSPAQGHTR
jgi:ketosteroid isomerase-like protein